MIYPIVVYGNPSLRKVSEPIDANYPGLAKLLEDMFETMYSSDGVGLAAPQIGKGIRLFIIDAAPMEEDSPTLKDFKKVFINAQIIKEEGEPWGFNEGCLSLPEIRESVNRLSTITVRYQDENFVQHEETYDGIKARIIQHEYDHIEGRLFIDHISPIRKRLIGAKLTAIEKGKVNPSYRVKFYKK